MSWCGARNPVAPVRTAPTTRACCASGMSRRWWTGSASASPSRVTAGASPSVCWCSRRQARTPCASRSRSSKCWSSSARSSRRWSWTWRRARPASSGTRSGTSSTRSSPAASSPSWCCSFFCVTRVTRSPSRSRSRSPSSPRSPCWMRLAFRSTS